MSTLLLVLSPLALLAGCYTSSPGEPMCPDPTDPRVHYVSTDPEECALIDWAGCTEGQTSIDPECGCGCVDGPTPPPTCPDPSDPRVHYVGDTPAECAAALFACDEDQTYIPAECGCGCIDPEPPVCEMGPEYRYVGHSPAQCAVIDFSCNEGEVYFGNDCGCGCRTVPTTCPDPSDPRVEYWSEDPTYCDMIDRACPGGTEHFTSPCGCGCIGTPTECPDPADPRVDYWSSDPGFCATVDAVCPSGSEAFVSECGCGCIEPARYCPSIHDPYVRYVGRPELCARADWGCNMGEVPFDDAECGCGCITRPGDECPQPTDFRVHYVADSPRECAEIDYLCPDGFVPFNGDCGCGCIADCGGTDCG